ncbi:MAG: histone deacetylase [Bacteroidetes bacterium]|nr:histone deacetylase [Bacteroidota bacterium]
MKVLYSNQYYAPIGEHHVFPMRKFEAIYETLRAEEVFTEADVIRPYPASEEDLMTVHTVDYLHRLSDGLLTNWEKRLLGLPWSEQLVNRSKTAAQGTLMAARIALRTAAACNIGGGTHHAFPDRGEGFCVLNDVAIAIRVLQRDGWIKKAMVVDLDVHQGNGTAFIFSGDPSVFTYSIHGKNNYPLRKIAGDLDLALPDGTGDEVYLASLRESLLPKIYVFKPDIVFFLAGADPYINDKLGRLALTIPGLLLRDQLVVELCKTASVPLVTVLSGGYAERTEDTVEIHCNTLRTVKTVFG